MGEIAEMMLDGTLCQSCGEYVGGDYGPLFCKSCERDGQREAKPSVAKPYKCSCGKKFRTPWARGMHCTDTGHIAASTAETVTPVQEKQ